jgi:hypothetical protein
MSRVIQDSDDELDDDLEVEVQQAEAKDASPKQFASDASSTGKRESHGSKSLHSLNLNRSITEADRSSSSSAPTVSISDD